MTLDLQRLSAALTAAAPDAVLPECLPASISGVADLAAASPTDLCFAEQADQAEAVAASAAIVLLVPTDFPEMPGKVLIRCVGPRRAFFAVAALFVPPPPPPGVDPGAHVHPSATLGEDVSIGPGAAIGAAAVIGARCVIAGGAQIGADVQIGDDCVIERNVTVMHGSRIGGQSGVTKDVPAGATVFGTPARDMKQTLRELGALAQLPELLRRVKRQERELAALQQRTTGGDPA